MSTAPTSVQGPSVVDPDLGVRLTSRGPSILGRLFHVVLSVVLVLFGWGIASAALSSVNKPQFSAPGMILGLLVALLIMWLAWVSIRAGLSVFHFHEFGATRHVLGIPFRTVRYDQAETLEYQVTRNYLNGIYTGTNVDICITPLPIAGKRGKRIACNLKHREKPDGVLSRTFLSKNFKGEDELDAIKNIIALAIAQRWLARGEFREAWCNHLLLTPRGLEFGAGPKKGTVIPFAKIKGLGGRGAGSVGPQSKYDYRELYVEGSERGHILIQTYGRNFWPGMMLIEVMRGRVGEDAATPPVPPPATASP
jgi:hypothetical protein